MGNVSHFSMETSNLNHLIKAIQTRDHNIYFHAGFFSLIHMALGNGDQKGDYNLLNMPSETESV